MTADNTSVPMDSRFSRRPIHSILALFSIACFAGTLVTDFVYWQTADVLWETFSDWLVTVGMIIAGLAILAWLISLVRGSPTPAWPYVVGYALVVLLSLINAFVHSRDAYTAVVPDGLTLSAVVVVILLFTAWVNRALVSSRRVGASA